MTFNFGAQPTNTFGGFGSTAAQPNPGFSGFGAPSTPSFGGFGAATSQPSTGFGGFGAATSQPSTGFGGFGAPTSQPSTAFGGFGAATSQPSTGFGGFGAATTQAGTGFGGFGAAATQANPGFGGFGTAASQPSTAFGGFGAATSQPSTGFGGFGATTSQPSTGFGGFGAAPTQTSTGFAGFGATTAQPSSGFGGFGAATSQPSTGFTGFGAATAQPSTGFAGFGAKTTTTGFGGFGTATSQPSFGGFGATTSQPSTGFGGFSGFGATAQPSAFSGFGTSQPSTGLGFGGSTMFGQPGGAGLFNQLQPAQPKQNPVDDLFNSVLHCSLFGDERDGIIARWNMLQASWGTGKAYYSNSAPPITVLPENPFSRFKAIGYSALPRHEDKVGLVSLVFKKKPAELEAGRGGLITTLSGILGNKPTLKVSVESIKATGAETSEAVVSLEESQNGVIKKISATDLSVFFNQPNQVQSLKNLGVEMVIPKVSISESDLEEYLNTAPAGVDPRLWKQAQLDNPDSKKFIPVPIIGFKDSTWKQENGEIHFIFDPYIRGKHKGSFIVRMKTEKGKMVLKGHTLPHAVPVKQLYSEYQEQNKDTTKDVALLVKNLFRFLRAFLSREDQVKELSEGDLGENIKEVQALHHHTKVQIILGVRESEDDGNDLTVTISMNYAKDGERPIPGSLKVVTDMDIDVTVLQEQCVVFYSNRIRDAIVLAF